MEYGTPFNANEKHAWRPEFESTRGEKKQESNKHELHSAFVLQGFFLGQSPSTDFHRLTTPQITNHRASSLLPLSLNFYEPFFFVTCLDLIISGYIYCNCTVLLSSEGLHRFVNTRERLEANYSSSGTERPQYPSLPHYSPLIITLSSLLNFH